MVETPSAAGTAVVVGRAVHAVPGRSCTAAITHKSWPVEDCSVPAISRPAKSGLSHEGAGQCVGVAAPDGWLIDRDDVGAASRAGPVQQSGVQDELIPPWHHTNGQPPTDPTRWNPMSLPCPMFSHELGQRSSDEGSIDGR